MCVAAGSVDTYDRLRIGVLIWCTCAAPSLHLPCPWGGGAGWCSGTAVCLTPAERTLPPPSTLFPSFTSLPPCLSTQHPTPQGAKPVDPPQISLARQAAAPPRGGQPPPPIPAGPVSAHPDSPTASLPTHRTLYRAPSQSPVTPLSTWSARQKLLQAITGPCKLPPPPLSFYVPLLAPFPPCLSTHPPTCRVPSQSPMTPSSTLSARQAAAPGASLQAITGPCQLPAAPLASMLTLRVWPPAVPIPRPSSGW